MHRRHRLVAALVTLAAVAAVAAALVGGGALDGPLLGDSAESVGADTTPAGEADRPLHEHPERAGDSLDRQTRDGLALLVGTSLEESAAQLREGDYEQARETLQGRRSELEDLVGAAVSAEGRDDIAEVYGQLRSTQRALATEREAYAETRDAYREAREVGNETRARVEARALGSHLDRLDRLHAATLEGYDRLSNVTEYDFTRAVEQTNETIAATRAEVEQAREETFVGTTLSLEPASTVVSYHDPLVLEVGLVDAAGEPVAGGEVVVGGDDRTVTVTTDENGTARLTYRPVVLPAGPATVAVAFQPESAGPYRPSRSTVNVTVEQVAGSLAVGGVPEVAAFGDPVEPTVRATTRGERVSGLPLTVQVGDTVVSDTTGADGTVTLPATLPAGLAPGEQRVTVAPPGGGAVTFEAVTRSLAVRASGTTLSVRATRSGGVELSGRLTAGDGTPVPRQSVVLSLGGERTVETTTGVTGRYSLTVENTPSGSFEAVATYTADGTNLESTEATTGVAAGSGGPARWIPGSDTLADAPPVALAGLAVAGLLVVVGAVTLVRRRGRDEVTVLERLDDDPEAAADPGERLHAARRALERRPGAAATLAYLVARRELESEVDGPAAATHREFLAACERDGLDDATLEDIATLTRCHERAAFGPGAVGHSTGETAVETAERLVGGDTAGSD